MWIFIAPLLFFAFIYLAAFIANIWVAASGKGKEEEDLEPKKAQAKNFNEKGYSYNKKKPSNSRRYQKKPQNTCSETVRKKSRTDIGKEEKRQMPQEEKEKIVTSPIFDGVTISDLQRELTPDDADEVSSEGYEDFIEAALAQEQARQMFGTE